MAFSEVVRLAIDVAVSAVAVVTWLDVTELFTAKVGATPLLASFNASILTALAFGCTPRFKGEDAAL